MILGAFGDSFLFGKDLSDCNYDPSRKEWSAVLPQPSKKTWPALISAEVNLDYICYALPGVGNQIILDDILRAVELHGNNMLYIINWTWIDRFDHIILNTKVPGLEYGQYNTLRPSEDNPECKFYYKNLHAELTDKIRNLTQVFSAIQALEISHCSYIMTFMDDLLLDDRWHAPASVRWMQRHCRPKLSSFDGKNFLDWSREKNFPESKCWHPLNEAHQAAAEYWLPKVRTLLNSSAKEEKSNASK